MVVEIEKGSSYDNEVHDHALDYKVVHESAHE